VERVSLSVAPLTIASDAGGTRDDLDDVLVIDAGTTEEPRRGEGGLMPHTDSRPMTGQDAGAREMYDRAAQFGSANVRGLSDLGPLDRFARRMRRWRIHGLSAGAPDFDEHRRLALALIDVGELLRVDLARVLTMGAGLVQSSEHGARSRQEHILER